VGFVPNVSVTTDLNPLTPWPLGRVCQLLYTAQRMTTIKSPLRYPGGKSRAIQRMEVLLPDEFDEYREPFVGGGSFFIHLKQKRPDLKIWINDLNFELYLFWKYAQENSEKLAEEVEKVRNKRPDGQKLFDELVKDDISKWSEFDRAVRFFILNRITFSGVVEAGGYSQQAFDTRFTPSSIERLAEVGKVLEGVKITNVDYSELLKDDNERIFAFLDPPYFTASKSKLYGKNGALHTGFDHDKFAREMKKCKQLWLITYDESDEVRVKFAFAKIAIQPWQLQYGMNNYKRVKAEKGHELFIANYDFLKL
jgi:DNA adenine methylase